MYVCMYIYIYEYVNVCMLCAYVYIYTCTRAHIYIYIRINMLWHFGSISGWLGGQGVLPLQNLGMWMAVKEERV